MNKIIITESQLRHIIKKVITKESHLEWFDDETNEAFENITDEKIIEAFEEYGLCANPNICNGCKIDYHPQGDVEVFYDTYELDGDYPDNIHKILKRISDKIGAKQMVYMEPESVKFLFYDKIKSIEKY
jgi:hypothetical protein